jgi:Tol biopolymer transport system component
MSSGGRTIVAILSVGLLLAASGIAEAAPAAETTLVSVHSDGTQGDDVSSFASISAHGRYVAFTSAASTLVTGDTNNGLDVFVHDRQTGTTTRVSLGLNGNQANGSSQEPSISPGGRYIAFYSGASNLVRGDTNRASDVFVYDRQTGTTSRVSLRSNGNQANRNSYTPSISADGRYVAFYSRATNLVRGDTNRASDVFVYDRQTGTTSRVSLRSNGNQANRNSSVPSISGNGRYVAFYSNASNLVRGDTNAKFDAFVHDRQTGTTRRVSVSSNGNQGNGQTWSAAISGNGRYVAFYSNASNLARGDTNAKFDAFVHDRQTGTTRRVSISSNGNQGNRSSYFPSISGDGRYVAFFSGASNLVRGDTNSRFDVFVRDRQTGTTRRVSVGPNGSQGNRVSGWPSISGDGQYVAFQSNASNLVPGDVNSTYDLFVRGPLH